MKFYIIFPAMKIAQRSAAMLQLLLLAGGNMIVACVICNFSDCAVGLFSVFVAFRVHQLCYKQATVYTSFQNF